VQGRGARGEDALEDPLIWVRAIHFGATMMVMGGVVFLTFIAIPAMRGRDGTGVAPRVRFQLAMIGWIGLPVTVLSGAAWLVLQAERMSELSLGQVFQQGVVWTVLSETDFGYAWMARFGLAGLLAALLPWLAPARWTGSSRMRAVAVVVSAGLVGTLAWAGHAAAGEGTEGAVHQVADILHLVAAAAWFGSLVPLALLLRVAGRDPAEASLTIARATVTRFSSLGIVSVGPIVATGVLNTWMLAGSLPALLGTNYGRLLVVKVALFLVMLSFGASNRLRLTPRLLHAGDAAIAGDALRQIKRNSLIEAGLGTVIVVIVGLLGTMAPGLQELAIN
jgi:putative copper resistance protein D